MEATASRIRKRTDKTTRRPHASIVPILVNQPFQSDSSSSFLPRRESRERTPAGGGVGMAPGSFHQSLSQKSKERLLLFHDSPRGMAPDRNGYVPILDPYDPCPNHHHHQHHRGWWLCCGCSLGDRLRGAIGRAGELVAEVWELGRSDGRKVVFAAKMGLSLTLLSFLMFLDGHPFEDINAHAVWAILTVVVVFEFSIGATLSKGFNRGLGTLLAGGLALGVAELAADTGPLEETIIIGSLFVAGFLVSFLKLHPTMAPYEYGFRVFMITFCMVVVSGYRTGEFIQTAYSRFVLICLGAGVALAVNIFIYPIWAGEDLHNLVAKNFANVATSLEGCVNGYLQCIEYERIPSKILTYQALDDPLYSGYRSVLESKSKEDSLLGFAVWEPPHGPYKMLKYPWESYVRMSGALRHCAFEVMALHGCILSEIQAPPERREVFRDELQRVGSECAKVLCELGNRIKTMTKLSPGDILYEVHEAAEALQNKIDRRSYLLVNSEDWEIGKRYENMEDMLDGEGAEKQFHGKFRTKSEAVLDLRYAHVPRSWGASTTKDVVVSLPSPTVSPQQSFHKQISWPHTRSTISDGCPPYVEESKTYESASALSLATFASLLIEFVARLSYLVESFQELSEKANFREPMEPPAQGSVLVPERCK